MKKAIIVLATLAVSTVLAILFFPRAKREIANESTSQATEQAEQDTSKSIIEPHQGAEKITAGALSAANWFSIDFTELTHQAINGDASAQWTLAKAYDYCRMFIDEEENFRKDIKTFGEMNPGSRSYLIRIENDMERRCPALTRYDIDQSGKKADPIKFWLQASAGSGNLTANLRLAALSQKLSDSRRSKLIQELGERGQPEDFFEFGQLAHRLKEPALDPWTKTVDLSKIHHEAWAVAACRSGLDCSKQSSIMFYICYMGGCRYENYQQYAFSQAASESERARLERDAQTIQAFISRNRNP